MYYYGRWAMEITMLQVYFVTSEIHMPKKSGCINSI